jgi:hypothetical protein
LRGPTANRAVADWLAEHGAADELSEVDRLVAACSRGDRAAADALLAGRPGLRDEIGAEHYVALYQAAERGNTRALATILASGFDPNRGDDGIGKTALHCAAREGWPDAVRILLAHGASVAARDREFSRPTADLGGGRVDVAAPSWPGLRGRGEAPAGRRIARRVGDERRAVARCPRHPGRLAPRSARAAGLNSFGSRAISAARGAT